MKKYIPKLIKFVGPWIIPNKKELINIANRALFSTRYPMIPPLNTISSIIGAAIPNNKITKTGDTPLNNLIRVESFAVVVYPCVFNNNVPPIAMPRSINVATKIIKIFFL